MSGFKVYKLTVSPVTLTDLGVTLTGAIGTIVDLTYIEATEIARSADLLAAINGTAPFTVPELLVVDSRDISGSTNYNQTDSVEAVLRHNDTHLGVSGGRFGGLDDPTVSFTDGHIVRYDATNDVFIACTPASFGPIVGSQGVDGSDTTYTYNASSVLHDAQDETFYDGLNNNGTFVGGDGVGGTSYSVNDLITLTDGSVLQVDAIDAPSGDVTQFTVVSSGATIVTAGAPIAQSGAANPPGGTGFVLTPQANNISTGTIQWDVDDAFLRNTGDTLDSGTLTIASGATVDFPTGSNLTIAGDVNTATIITPAGGFTGNTDLINKEYVDAIAGGLDWKESVRGATTIGQDIGGTFNSTGGTGGTGEFTNIDLTSNAIFDGVPALIGGFQIGDRILVKDQSTPSENGIYVVTATGATGTIERASDQDGSPASEISGGNTTFIDNGTVQANTIWSVIWDGQINLNSDPINWSQTGATTDVLANEGLNSSANEINLDISTLTQTLTTLDGANDYLVFEDTAGSAGTDTTTTRILVDDFISDQNIVTITTNGIIVNNGGTYTTVAIAVNGAGPLDGLAVANADGTAGNPTLGLDILNLPTRPTVDPADLVAVYDQAGNNVSYTVSDIAGAISATNSYGTWARGGNGTGGPVGPNSAADTVTLNGGVGIDIDMLSNPDSVTFTFSRSGMADTAIVSTDTFPFFDDTAADPEYRSFADALGDLDVPFGLTGTGIVVRTGESPDTYDVRTITVEGAGAEAGLSIDNGDGVAGNPVIGLDIDGLASAGENLAAADELVVYNSDATANESMNGQEIADGVADILNITGLSFSTITSNNSPTEDQTLLTFIDNTRTGNPVLSVESHMFSYSDNSLSDNSWISIGDAVDSDSGFIMPFDGMIVGASVHTENAGGGNTYSLDVVVGAPAAAGTSTTIFTGITGANYADSDPTFEITFNAGDKIRIQASQTAGTGTMQDTVATLMVRWSA